MGRLKDDEAWFREKFGERKAWLMGADKGARLWGDFQKNQVAALGWDDVRRDLNEYNSQKEIHETLVRMGGAQTQVTNHAHYGNSKRRFGLGTSSS